MDEAAQQSEPYELKTFRFPKELIVEPHRG